ncbi:MAG: sulfatase [Verrucomicrobiales bacterium]|nr:sulfatase [Verrucomicrobiales bacterium]
MKRFLSAVFLACLIPATAGIADEKPNVLFIAADDLANVFGKTRPKGLKTPHLDRLMEHGVFFERAYCQIPLCNPSRASVMTGLRPDAIDVFDLDRHFRESQPKSVTLSQLFKNHGYYVARVGKIYHYNVPKGIGTNGLDDAPSWQEVINPIGRDVADEPLIFNAEPHRAISAAMSWLPSAGEDSEQTDGKIADDAVRLLEEHKDEPFFLAAGFFRPHTPYVAPAKYFDQYPLVQIELTNVPENDRDDIPPAAIPHNIPLPDYGLEDDILTPALRAYLASVSFVDANVGTLLDALDRLGLSDNTIVVFWSDHGYHLGEHFLWQKRTLFDPSARAPVIMADPRIGDTKGRTCRRIVEFVDIYPTVADLAGLPLHEHQELAGRSLQPLLKNPEAEWGGVGITQILRPLDGGKRHVMGRSITTERWRYIDWAGGAAGRELYDHETDPDEHTNLADKPEHADLIQKLKAQLDEHASPEVPTVPFNTKRL